MLDGFDHRIGKQHIISFRLLHVKLIAFELAGEDRNRRENPVLSRLKIAFFALHKRG